MKIPSAKTFLPHFLKNIYKIADPLTLAPKRFFTVNKCSDSLVCSKVCKDCVKDKLVFSCKIVMI